MNGFTFEPVAHRYHLDGVRVPSVTGVLQRSGLIDFSHMPPAVLHEAQVRGTIVHSAVRYFNEGDLAGDAFREDFPMYVGYLDGWQSFCAQRRYTPVLNEHIVASRRYQLAGTVDSIGVLDGEAVLLDFATGRPQDAAKDLQTAAYLALAREWAAEGDALLADYFRAHAVVRRYAVALRRDGTFRVEPYADPSHFRQFMTLLQAQQIVDARRQRDLAAEVA